MKFQVDNTYTALRISLTVLKLAGFWSSKKEVDVVMGYLYPIITFMLMAGISIIVQMVDLFQIWGDVPLMTEASYLLFTNVAFAVKMVNMLCRRKEVRAIVEECDEALANVDTEWGKEILKSRERQSKLSFYVYTCLPYVTIIGMALGSASKGELPTRAWYPYDTTKSPAYEITYTQQAMSVFLGATVNVSLDILVIALIAQCCCRLRLLATKLKKLGGDVPTDKRDMFTPDQEVAIKASIRICIVQHQAVLEAAGLIQRNFSMSILAQVSVSLITICVTAYQLALESSNKITIFAMTTYMMCIMMQLFLYCYQGQELSDESGKIAGAVYECLWYKMAVSLRRELLILMLRSQRIARLTVGGFTTLSLNTYMVIIKTSYSLFTVLQAED